MVPLFDLDTPPVGDQLTIIGQWVGASRNVNIPEADVSFSWDNTDLSLGWDKGSWGSGGTDVLVLPDDAYLLLIKATIGANNWDGTTTQAYEIYDEIFSPFQVLIQDDHNMSYDIAIVGGVIPALTLALLTGGYIRLKPEGIRINKYYVPTDTNPAFAWDLDTTYCQGWDTGSWMKEIPNTNIPF